MQVTHGSLVVPGAKLYYKVRGEGPPLLILQGGGGDADTPDALASTLAGRFTVITFDRRGLSRSPLSDPKQIVTIEQHANDALFLLDEIMREPAFVFGSSLGSLVALELVLQDPQRIDRVVAHDPPLFALLSAEEQQGFRELRSKVTEIALCQGTRPAMRHFLVSIGVDNDDREDDAEPPPSGRERARNSGFFLSRDSRAADQYKLDIFALRALAGKVMPAFGLSSRACFPSRCALALARELERPPLGFPGGHTGYVLRPRAFAEQLARAFGTGPLSDEHHYS
jgi:pimeloyl-ACP methyl ester carboxylesterase